LFGDDTFQLEAAPVASNTNARKPAFNIFSSEFKNADRTAVVNACVTAGFFNDCGFLELRCASDNTLVWGVNNTFGGGAGGVVFMGSTGFMKTINTAFSYDETTVQLAIQANSTSTDPRLIIENAGTGDATQRYTITGASSFSVGIDNSLGDRYRISRGTSIDSNTDFTLTGGGDFGFGLTIPVVKMHVQDTAVVETWSPTQGTVAIFENGDASRCFVVILAGSGGQSELHFADENDQTRHRLRVNHVDDSMQFRVNNIDALFLDSSGFVGINGDPDAQFHPYLVDSTTTAQILMEQDGGGDTVFTQRLTGLRNFSFGIDNSDGDKWKLTIANTVRSVTPVFAVDDSRNVAVNANTAASRFDINGSFGVALNSVSANTTLTSAHHTVLVDATGGARTITLPAASGCSGRIYCIKKTDASGNAVTVDGNASETIDGSTTNSLSSQYDGVTIQSDGSNWHILV
jgi:hypothetical protein